MQIFRYRVRNLNGEVTTGKREANSAAALSAVLAKEGYVVEQISGGSGMSLLALRSKGVRTRDMLNFLRELRVVEAAGININEALKMVEVRHGSQQLTTALKELNGEIRQGRSLWQAAELQPSVFEPELVMTFRIGVTSGQLAAALERYENDLTMRQDLAQKLRRAIAYPAFLVGLLAVVLVILFLFILPSFVSLYDDFDSELPWATQMLLNIVDAAPIWITVCILLGIAFALTWSQLRQRTGGRRMTDQFVLRLPLFGPIVRDGTRGRAASSLALLLLSGMPLQSCLVVVAGSLQNSVFAERLKQAAQELKSGKNFSTIVKETDLFGTSSQSLIRAGEKTGALGGMLSHVSKLHQTELSHRVALVATLIEPLLMVVVGSIIGVIIVVVYLPIFGVTDVIQ